MNREHDRNYSIMVKVRNEDPYLPPSRHLDTMELPKGERNPVEDEKELVSLLYLVYKREMKVSLQVSRGGFKTCYRGLIDPVFRKTRRGGKRLRFVRFKSFEESLEYYLGIEPVHPTTEKDNRWIKIEDPESLVPSKFLEEKREEFQDYQEGSRHRVNEKERF
ncbi:MAG: hypothetical protein ABEJ07_04405 [Candidatus Nanohaloarchaea archaeon]